MKKNNESVFFDVFNKYNRADLMCLGAGFCFGIPEMDGGLMLLNNAFEKGLFNGIISEHEYKEADAFARKSYLEFRFKKDEVKNTLYKKPNIGFVTPPNDISETPSLLNKANKTKLFEISKKEKKILVNIAKAVLISIPFHGYYLEITKEDISRAIISFGIEKRNMINVASEIISFTVPIRKIFIEASVKAEAKAKK
jgi:hypothetical protein